MKVLIDGVEYIPVSMLSNLPHCSRCVKDRNRCPIEYCIKNDYKEFVLKPSLKKKPTNKE